MLHNNPLERRWKNYLLKQGKDFHDLWKDLLSSFERNVLYIAGLGFDPRAPLGLTRLIQIGGGGQRTALIINFDEGPTSPSKSHADLKSANQEEFSKALDGVGVLELVQLPMLSEDGRRVGSRKASGMLDSVGGFEDYTDIIVDVSAMPRSIFFPLIAKLLYMHDSVADSSPSPFNLHVIAAESSSLDQRIVDEGIAEDATYIHGFSSDLEREAIANVPVIWIPVLGEGMGIQLEKISEMVNPDEVSPLVPWPSLNPRRGDNILIEHSPLLRDRLSIEPRNIVYAPEQNPFGVYRQIYRTAVQYHHALSALGGCKTVISALSSKLLSIGALLAAYELKQNGYQVGIAHVEANGYRLQGSVEDVAPEMFTLWLTGECYG